MVPRVGSQALLLPTVSADLGAVLFGGPVFSFFLPVFGLNHPCLALSSDLEQGTSDQPKSWLSKGAVEYWL